MKRAGNKMSNENHLSQCQRTVAAGDGSSAILDKLQSISINESILKRGALDQLQLHGLPGKTAVQRRGLTGHGNGRKLISDLFLRQFIINIKKHGQTSLINQ